MTRQMLFRYIVLALVLASTSMFNSGCERVQPGEAGVKANFIIGGVNPRPVENSWTLVIPGIQDLEIYDVRRRAEPLTEASPPDPDLSPEEREARRGMLLFNTKDGQKIWVELLIDFSLDPTGLPDFHQRIGPDYFSQVIQPVTLNNSRNILADYDAVELFQGEKRREVQRIIADTLRSDEINLEGLTIFEVIIKQILFLPAFQEVVEDAQITQQQLAVQRARTEVINQTNLNLRKEEEGIAAARVVQAEGFAAAAEIEARGQAATFKVQADFLAKQSRALQGGQNVAAYELARNISDDLKIYGIPTGGGGGGDGGLGALGLFTLIGLNPELFTGDTMLPLPPEPEEDLRSTDDLKPDFMRNLDNLRSTPVPTPGRRQQQPVAPRQQVPQGQGQGQGQQSPFYTPPPEGIGQGAGQGTGVPGTTPNGQPQPPNPEQNNPQGQ